MYGVLITGIVLWVAIGFIASVCAYAIADTRLTIREVVTCSVGFSTAGPFMVLPLMVAAAWAVAVSPAVWGEV